VFYKIENFKIKISKYKVDFVVFSKTVAKYHFEAENSILRE